jgi:hypothetical protein
VTYLQTLCQNGKLGSNQEVNCDHNTGRLAMSHSLNNIMARKADIFIEIKLLVPKTTDVLILNV